MALARVHDRQLPGAPRRQQLPVGLDGPAQLRDVVAEHLAEAARLEEVALHVDDEQRAAVPGELEGIRLACTVMIGSYGHEIALMNAWSRPPRRTRRPAS